MNIYIHFEEWFLHDSGCWLYKVILFEKMYCFLIFFFFPWRFCVAPAHDSCHTVENHWRSWAAFRVCRTNYENIIWSRNISVRSRIRLLSSHCLRENIIDTSSRLPPRFRFCVVRTVCMYITLPRIRDARNTITTRYLHSDVLRRQCLPPRASVNTPTCLWVSTAVAARDVENGRCAILLLKRSKKKIQSIWL